MNKQQTNPDIDQYEAATEEAIEACGGDARAAVKALLIVNAFLEDELVLAKMAVSYGYSKGWHARKRDV